MARRHHDRIVYTTSEVLVRKSARWARNTCAILDDLVRWTLDALGGTLRRVGVSGTGETVIPDVGKWLKSIGPTLYAFAVRAEVRSWGTSAALAVAEKGLTQTAFDASGSVSEGGSARWTSQAVTLSREGLEIVWIAAEAVATGRFVDLTGWALAARFSDDDVSGWTLGFGLLGEGERCEAKCEKEGGNQESHFCWCVVRKARDGGGWTMLLMNVYWHRGYCRCIPTAAPRRP